MSFAYNASVLLRVIRGSEFNVAAFVYTDVQRTELSYHGSLINLSMIKSMIDDQLQVYCATLRQKAFFGEEIPQHLLPPILLDKLADDVHCRNIGYSFIDDPRNNFLQYKSTYGEWLLSTPERRNLYIRMEGSSFVWNIAEAVKLLKAFQAIELELVPGLIYSAGPSARGTEVSRQLLREMAGCFRNVGIVMHSVSFNSTTDKSSHLQLVDRFVPHTPSREWAIAFVQYLVIIRPFAEHLVESLFAHDTDLLNRYRFFLWPGIAKTLSAEDLSQKLGKITETSLGIRFGIKHWRCLTTTILQAVSDEQIGELNRQYFHDTANMHSTRTAMSKYGGNTANMSGSDSRIVSGCVLVGKSWQNRIGLTPQVLDIQDVTTQQTHSSSILDASSSQLQQIKDFRDESIATIAATVSESMASAGRAYFPAPLPPQTSLHRVSDIEVHPSRLIHLRTFLNDEKAEWSCPEQALFVERLVLGQDNILAILGTGFGKTTMIMFIAKMFAQAKIILVIMPLVALHEDLHQRARQYGLSASRWKNGGKFNPNVNIITAAIEDLLNDSFVQ